MGSMHDNHVSTMPKNKRKQSVKSATKASKGKRVKLDTERISDVNVTRVDTTNGLAASSDEPGEQQVPELARSYSVAPPVAAPAHDDHSDELPNDDQLPPQRHRRGPRLADHYHTHFEAPTKSGFFKKLDRTVNQLLGGIESGVYDNKPETVSRKLKDLRNKALSAKNIEDSYLREAQQNLDEEYELWDGTLVVIEMAMQSRADKNKAAVSAEADKSIVDDGNVDGEDAALKK